MMARAGLRIGVVGATGTLGTELLELLDLSSLRVSEIVPFATDSSLGREIEFQGSLFPIETDEARLMGLDLVFLCAPPSAALDFVRRALREHVPCIDLSGATAGTEDVPMRIAGYGSVPEDIPLIAIPTSPALALVLALQPIASAAGLRRVSGAVLEAASWAGKDGMATLYQESIAIFSQQSPPESTVFPGPVAFDCMSGAEGLDADGLAPRESALIRDLALLLGDEVKIATTLVQVPIFVGVGAALCIETERDFDIGEVEDWFRKAPGVDLAADTDCAPTTRAVVGRDSVLVGRMRVDPSAERGLQLWLAADPLRLAASHAIQLAVLRLT
jgi:aspartate-semialdehyde dehydrogenase